jgi:hypothetical protein
MTDTATLTTRLSSLLAQVPTKTLHLGQVAGDKPGILAGDMPICRVRETPEGAQYAELITEGINALPRLIAMLSAPNEAYGAPSATDSPLRQQIEGKITETLQLLPGFKASATTTWAKLIYAAIEPRLVGGREALDTAAPAITQQPRNQQARSADGEKQARLEAVMEFCNFMLAQDDGESRPNEHALEQLVTEWDKAHNGALPEQNGAAGQ